MVPETSTQKRANLAKIAALITEKQEITEGQPVSMTLDEFHQLYIEMVYQLSNKNPYVSLILLPDQALMMFPQYSRQVFRVFPASHQITLTETNFSFILWKEVYGVRKPLPSFKKFLQDELRNNRKWLIPVFLLSCVGLYFANNNDLYNTLSGLLIQSATVFASIFLIFTIAQSTLVQQDFRLFKYGQLHRYRRDDRNVTILSIITIGLVIFNSIFLGLPYDFVIKTDGLVLEKTNFWGAISTSIIITLLLNGFISVVNYYLERTQDLVDRDLVQKIFEAEREKLQK